MDVQALKAKIKDAEDRISKEKEYVRQAKQDIAEHLCPFKVGDEVINKNGDRQIVASIRYCGWSRAGYDFKIFKIKKDGTPYQQSCDAWGVGGYSLAPASA